MSPSPASPIEGDKLCEIDVTDVAIHSVTLLISLCGLAGNGAVIGFYSLESCTYAVFNLAVIDFLFLLFTVPSGLLFLMEDVSCSIIMPLTYVRFLFQLSVVSYYWMLLWLLASTDVRNIFKLCCRCDLPKRLWLVLDNVQFWVFFTVFTVIPVLTSLCPSHEQQHCQAAVISIYTIILLLFVAPLIISHAIGIIKAKRGSKKQQLKRRDIIVSIIVLLTLLLILCDFLQQLCYNLVSSQVFFLLTCIHSTIKPFICFIAGRCWSPCSVGSLRLSLQRVFVEKEENTDQINDATLESFIKDVSQLFRELSESRIESKPLDLDLD